MRWLLERPAGVAVPAQHAAAPHPQQVAPPALHGVEHKRPKPHACCLRHPDALVVGQGGDGQIADHLGRLHGEFPFQNGGQNRGCGFFQEAS